MELCEDKDSLFKREAEIVNEQVLDDPLNMNLKLGGKGGWDYFNLIISNEQKQRRSSRRVPGITKT